MNKIEYSFISLTHSIDMIFESATSIDDFNFDFLLVFTKETDIDNKNHKIDIQSLQQNTVELREKIDLLIEKYKDVNIKVFKLKTYFQGLTEDENFMIIPGSIPTLEQSLPFYNYLTSLRDGTEYSIVTEQVDSLFGELRQAYTIRAIDGKRKTTIGEQDKSKRICRFCNNKRQKVTFKNVAHAISESLGNKTIILNEECDECNSEFGSASGIEGSLITFLKIYGVFFGIKGKNGVPKMKGRNFKLSNDGQINIKHYADNDDEIGKEKDLGEVKFRLDTFENIVMQDIYRTLCKYALSVVDSTILPHFQNTINWINGDTTIPKLPKVAILYSYNFFRTEPSLIIYLRQNKNTDLPYAVGEFHYTYLTFVFIIPLTEQDDKDFVDEKDFNNFWSFFKHYSSTKDWEYRNFSDSTTRKFTINMGFKPRTDKSTNA